MGLSLRTITLTKYRKLSPNTKNLKAPACNLASLNLLMFHDDAPLRRQTRVALHHSALNLDGAAHCIDYAAELNQRPIAGADNDALDLAPGLTGFIARGQAYDLHLLRRAD
jgi:hypothetical protein